MYRLGMVLSVRGRHDEGVNALKLSLQHWLAQDERQQQEGLLKAYLAECYLQDKKTIHVAQTFADEAWDLADVGKFEVDYIRASRLQGTAALARADWLTAENRLNHALKRARTGNLVEEVLPTMLALARLHLNRKDLVRANELIEEVLKVAPQGPYPKFNAAALNLKADWEVSHGNAEIAAIAASDALQEAWCDGEPYSCAVEVDEARQMLKRLGKPCQELKPFEMAFFPAMPLVSIATRKRPQTK